MTAADLEARAYRLNARADTVLRSPFTAAQEGPALLEDARQLIADAIYQVRELEGRHEPAST